MRKRLLTFVLLFFYIQSVNAQFALLKMNVNDCGKFTKHLDSFIKETKSQTPMFVIFPYYEAKDQTKISASLGEFAKVCPPIFDDAMYEQTTKAGQQGVYYFSKNGDIIFKEPIVDISIKTFQTIDGIYKNDFHFVARNNVMHYMLNDDICQQDIQLNTLKKLKHQSFDNYFELSPDLLKAVVDSINAIDSNYLALDRLYAKWHNQDLYEMLSPKYFITYGMNSAEYFTVGITKQLYRGKDTSDMVKKIIANDENLGLGNYLLLLKFENNEFQKVIFVEHYANEEQGVRSCTIAYKPINDTTFLSLVGNTEISPENQNFFAVYKLRGRHLVFEKQLPIPFPKDYTEQKLNYVQLSMIAMSYPYFFPNLSQYMIDFSMNESHIIDSMYGGIELVDKEKGWRRIITNQALFSDATKGYIYLIARMGANRHSCFLIDVKQKKVVRHFAMQASKLPTSTKEYPVILDDKTHKRFFLEDPEGKVRAYPLVFLEQL